MNDSVKLHIIYYITNCLSEFQELLQEWERSFPHLPDSSVPNTKGPFLMRCISHVWKHNSIRHVYWKDRMSTQYTLRTSCLFLKVEYTDAQLYNSQERSALFLSSLQNWLHPPLLVFYRSPWYNFCGWLGIKNQFRIIYRSFSFIQHILWSSSSAHLRDPRWCFSDSKQRTYYPWVNVKKNLIAW